MIISGSSLLNYPVLSLHIGGPIGKTIADVVDPNTLDVIAYTVDGPEIGDGENGDILETDSIREYSNIGVIIDSIDELVSEGDVIKLDNIMKLNFGLIDLKVKTKKGTYLGKVSDYTVDTKTFKVVQLIVKRPVLKAIIDPELVISRNEIAEVNDYEIIVKDEEDKIRKEAVRKDFVPNFVNPFREPAMTPIESKRASHDD